MVITTKEPEATQQDSPPQDDETSFLAQQGRRWVLRVVLFGLFFGAWEIIVATDVVREIVVPRPSDVLVNFIETVTSTAILRHLSITLQETLLGFTIGSSIGLTLAMIVVLAPKVTFVIQDYITAFQSIPKVVFIPILITWFGFGMESKIVLAATISFFPVYITAVVGMNGTPASSLRLMVLMKANRFERLYKLQFLHALPTIFAGIKNALTNALIGSIVAEFFGATSGLGYLIVINSHAVRIPEVFSVIIILSLLAVIGYVFVDWVGRKIVFWMPRD